ncbi:MAG: type I DNA topoisomerase, partial [Actinobacteria bacterium]|nr:type I DNA topoisomerase [Actinomycetota bacterium]
MGKALVIVESPAKAKTIGAMLGKDFIVESSIGHIRDLPQSAEDIPAAYKGESWSRLGVNVDDGFKAVYVVSRNKREVVRNLKRLLKGADELYLATDEDREGESIAWHLVEELNPTVPVKRMVFHEITKSAIERAVNESRDIDAKLVDAQEARRILDRLYGYEVSPVLWKKVAPRLSAGRVQSVATRLVVERERERMAFTRATWFDVVAWFAKSGQSFEANLTEVDGLGVATGSDYDSTGQLTAKKAVRALTEAEVSALAQSLPQASPKVASVTEKPFSSSPKPPFMTSTLQQEAGRKLRLSAQMAMRTAQRLYEQGWITYMRTDSTTLSDEALSAARSQARELFGAEYVPEKPRRYERKVKNAQEAHEAIRPAGEEFRTPEEASRTLNGDEFRLYELIWMRTIASQMTDARGTSAQVKVAVTVPDSASALAGSPLTFTANGRIITFPGYRRAYVEGADDPEAELADRERVLPAVLEGDGLDPISFEAKDHSTQPPARYTDASLVKKMEELGIGRPSTYASVITTIQDRGYVFKQGSAIVPSFVAFAVVSLMEQHFSDLVNYEFTAAMENDLDEIAGGRLPMDRWLTRFYFGKERSGEIESSMSGETIDFGLKETIEKHLGEIDARAINSISLGADEDGVEIVARVGKFGPYLMHGEDTVSIPNDTLPDELTVARALELLAAPKSDRELGMDPESDTMIYVKAGRFGPYVQLGEMVGKEKPKTASLFKTMTPETVTFEEALLLLSQPREIGNDPETGELIEALNGRYGAYLRKSGIEKADSRSLETEDQIFTVTMEEALAIFAQPKTRRGRGQAAPPLRELGPDPDSELPIVLKEGRFGPYVTDGVTNASLRVGDSVETITIERALELLAIRREAGPAKKRTKKAAAKKKA